MLMGCVWVGMLAVSLLYGAWSGNTQAVSAAVMEGAGTAVSLCISLAGALGLWSGFLKLLESCGLAGQLAAGLSPLLRRLFPRAFEDEACARSLSANVSANLLGLGNAATPAGLRTVERMAQLGNCEREMARLVVMNTASVQLLPTTVAAVRAAAGCENAFDILPCVWLSSLLSVSAGLLAAWLLEGKA